MIGKPRSERSKQSKKKSSARWLDRQHSDPYVQQARAAGYRSRAAYKLLELQEKDRILEKGMTVVDLGAAPGGWSQVAAKIVGRTGHVVAIDILAMEPLNGVDIVLGDFESPETIEKLIELLGNKPVDLVMSDMAPNMSGIAVVDQTQSVYLAEVAVAFAERVLTKKGTFLVKIFQGPGFQEYFKFLKERFDQVLTRKPKASRAESREVYLLAKGYKRAHQQEDI